MLYPGTWSVGRFKTARTIATLFKVCQPSFFLGWKGGDQHGGSHTALTVLKGVAGQPQTARVITRCMKLSNGYPALHPPRPPSAHPYPPRFSTMSRATFPTGPNGPSGFPLN